MLRTNCSSDRNPIKRLEIERFKGYRTLYKWMKFAWIEPSCEFESVSYLWIPAARSAARLAGRADDSANWPKWCWRRPVVSAASRPLASGSWNSTSWESYGTAWTATTDRSRLDETSGKESNACTQLRDSDPTDAHSDAHRQSAKTIGRNRCWYPRHAVPVGCFRTEENKRKRARTFVARLI